LLAAEPVPSTLRGTLAWAVLPAAIRRRRRPLLLLFVCRRRRRLLPGVGTGQGAVVRRLTGRLLLSGLLIRPLSRCLGGRRRIVYLAPLARLRLILPRPVRGGGLSINGEGAKRQRDAEDCCVQSFHSISRLCLFDRLR